MLARMMLLFLLFTSCQSFDIKDIDTIHEAELKVVQTLSKPLKGF